MVGVIHPTVPIEKGLTNLTKLEASLFVYCIGLSTLYYSRAFGKYSYPNNQIKKLKLPSHAFPSHLIFSGFTEVLYSNDGKPRSGVASGYNGMSGHFV